MIEMRMGSRQASSQCLVAELLGRASDTNDLRLDSSRRSSDDWYGTRSVVVCGRRDTGDAPPSLVWTPPTEPLVMRALMLQRGSIGALSCTGPLQREIATRGWGAHPQDETCGDPHLLRLHLHRPANCRKFGHARVDIHTSIKNQMILVEVDFNGVAKWRLDELPGCDEGR